MDRFVIEGGVTLRGSVEVSGAKNSALPVLAACLLTGEPVQLDRIPQVKDIRTMMDLLRHMGARVDEDGTGQVKVVAVDELVPEAPYEVVKTMRPSFPKRGPRTCRPEMPQPAPAG